MTNDRSRRAARAEQMRKEREREERRRRTLISVAVVAAVALVLGIGGWAVIAANKSNDTPYAAPAHSSAGYTVVDQAAPLTKGARTLDAYEDFSCSACKGFETQSGTALDKATKAGKMRLVMHPVAILDRVSSTKYSTRAANAAACVLDEGGVADYLAFHRLLFANQPAEGGTGLSDAKLVSYAAEAGASGSHLRACVKGGTYEPWVKRATRAFTDKYPASTPTLVVAGRQVRGPKYDGSYTVPSLAKVEQALGLAD